MSLRRGLFAAILIAPLFLTGCPLLQIGRGVHRTKTARDSVSSNTCFNYQKLLTDAHREFREKEPRKAARMQVGSKEWERYLDKKRYLIMAMFCPDAYGDRVFMLAEDGRTIICKKHGNWREARAKQKAARAGKTRKAPGTPKPPVEGPPSDALNMVLHGLGMLFLALAGWQYVSGGEAEDLIEALRENPVRPAREIGAQGYYSVQGSAQAAEPLVAPRSREKVVFYRYRQLEEWEERPRNQAFWTKVERVLKEDVESVPFVVRDGSGEVEVNTRGARMDGKRLAREYVGASGSASQQGGRGSGLGTEYRNHRYVHEVSGIVQGEPVFVIGPTRGGAQSLGQFAASPDEERPFVVTGRRPQELLEHSRESHGVSAMFLWLFAGLAVLCFLGGFLLPPM